ncbi:MAG: DUF6788 family protein [candidate division WOR-3 bacterium]
MDILKIKQQKLIKMLPPLDKIIRGTFRKYYLTCGTKSCRCHHGGKKHGPYAYLGITDKGKTIMRRVPKEIETEVKGGVRLYDRLWRVIIQLCEVNRRLIWRRAERKQH